MTLPTSTHSIEGLMFVGFVRETAAQLFHDYETRSGPDSTLLEDIVTAYLSKMNQSPLKESSPREIMTTLGIRQNVQDGILDPRFANMFGTGTLSH
jgi:hypothetical protein